MIPLITRQHKKPTFNLALLKTKYSFDLITDFLASLNALDYQITSLEVFEDYLSDFSDEVLREAKKATEKAIEKANITGKSPEEVERLANELEEIEQTQEEIYHEEWERQKAAEREREYWEEEAKKAAEDEVGKPIDDLTDDKIEKTEEVAKETESTKEEVTGTGGAGGVIDAGTGKSGTASESGRTSSTGETTISKAREEIEKDKESTKTAMDSVTIENQNPVPGGTITNVDNTREKTWTEKIADKLPGARDDGDKAKNGETIIVTTDTGATISIKNETGEDIYVAATGEGTNINTGDGKGGPVSTTNLEDAMNGKGIPGTTITINTPTVGGGTATSTVKTDSDGKTTVVTTSTTADGTKTTTTIDADGKVTHTAVTKDGETQTSWVDDNGVTHTNGVGKDSEGNTTGYTQSENEDGVIVTENKDGTGNTTSVDFDGTPVAAPETGDSVTIDGIGTITMTGENEATWTDTSGNEHTGTPVVDDDGNITGIDITN